MTIGHFPAKLEVLEFSKQLKQRDALPMDEKLRVTVVALLAPGVTPEDVRDFIGQISGGRDEPGAVRIFKTPPLDDGSRKLYIKVSRIMGAAEVDDGWNLRITRKFKDAGYGKVAWKITPVVSGDLDAEATTASIPMELLADCLGTGAGEYPPPEEPPAPFGSDEFWQWFEEASL